MVVQNSKATLASTLNAYIALTKPKIIILLLMTSVGGMFLAKQGVPSLDLIALVLFGGSLAAAGANAINQYLEKDIDAVMSRTSKKRPLVSESIPPSHALVFGLLTNLIAFGLLWILVNPESAILTLSASGFYIFIYTMILKRRTSQNIVIGGAAGAIPPLVGWVAVRGYEGVYELAPAICLFIIIFVWTPPHFWALSLLLKDDYKLAQIPMLPVVAGVQSTKWAILRYTILLVVITLLTYWAFRDTFGPIYLFSCLILGVLFIGYVVKLLRTEGINGAKKLYLFSIAYLGVIFIAIIIDSVLFELKY